MIVSSLLVFHSFIGSDSPLFRCFFCFFVLSALLFLSCHSFRTKRLTVIKETSSLLFHVLTLRSSALTFLSQFGFVFFIFFSVFYYLFLWFSCYSFHSVPSCIALLSSSCSSSSKRLGRSRLFAFPLPARALSALLFLLLLFLLFLFDVAQSATTH